ncbi:MAG: hypothetical protein KDJ47_03690 [Hyphomicrobiaceae bacterium]|nr:hypothetical protein [Hyphomicrobiaceae bacterium]
MLHPQGFLLDRMRLPESAVPVLRRANSVTRLTLLFANYSDRSEVVAYATTVHATDGSVLIEPPLDINERFFSEAVCVCRGLTAIAALSAALIEDVPWSAIYRVAGLDALTYHDDYFEGMFAEVSSDNGQMPPPEFQALAKLDLSDPHLPRLHRPLLRSVRDGHALKDLAAMACELIEKPALWDVRRDESGDDVKSVRLEVAARLATESAARRALYFTAGRSRSYRRADVRSTRFAGR